MSFHPSLGRFVERDPVEYDDTMNLYSASVGYSINDSFQDPFDGDKWLGKKIEHPGGTPYAITASWDSTVSGEGKLPLPASCCEDGK